MNRTKGETMWKVKAAINGTAILSRSHSRKGMNE